MLQFHPENTWNSRFEIESYVIKDHPELLEEIKERVLFEAFRGIAKESLHENGVNIKTELKVEESDLRYTEGYGYIYCREPIVTVKARCYISHPRDIQWKAEPLVSWRSYETPKLRNLIVQLIKQECGNIKRKTQRKLKELEDSYLYTWS